MAHISGNDVFFTMKNDINRIPNDPRYDIFPSLRGSIIVLFENIDRSAIKATLIGEWEGYNNGDLSIFYPKSKDEHPKRTFKRFQIELFLGEQGFHNVNTDLMEVFNDKEKKIFQLVAIDRNSGLINTQTGENGSIYTGNIDLISPSVLTACKNQNAFLWKNHTNETPMYEV